MSLRGEDMVCVLVEKGGWNAIFLDEKGTEYLITKEQFNGKYDYKNALFSRVSVPKYTLRRGVSMMKFKDSIIKFLDHSFYS